MKSIEGVTFRFFLPCPEWLLIDKETGEGEKHLCGSLAFFFLPFETKFFFLVIEL
jgi:hypothetical protein